MTIKLLEGIQLAGVHQAVGSIITLAPDAEARHVSSNKAVYTVQPDIGDDAVPVTARKTLTGGISILASTNRPQTWILFGDSRTAGCNYDAGVNTYSTNLSWAEIGNGIADGGPPLRIIKNAGVGGNTTQQMLDRVDADVISYSPGYVSVWGCVNDGWGSSEDVDASFSRMKIIILRLVNAGSYVFVISETACSSVKGTAYSTYLARYNDKLRALCADIGSAEFWDFNKYVVDPTSANGYAKSNMLSDGVHPSPYGCSVFGKYVVGPSLSRLGLPSISSLVCSLADTQSYNAASNNILGNPLMLGSVVASGVGQTGNWPTGWTTSGKDCESSVVARADGFGNDLVGVITSTSAGSFFANYIGTPSRIVPGAKYIIEAHLEISGAVEVTQVSVTADFGQSGSGYRRGCGYAVNAPASGDSIVDITRVVMSEVFTAPDGAYTGLSMLFRVLFSTAGACNFKLGRVGIKRVQ